MILKNFEALNHVGGVVCASDDEKLKNLFKLLNEEIVKRKERLFSVGVSSFSSYKEAGYADMPQIILLYVLSQLNENSETVIVDDVSRKFSNLSQTVSRYILDTEEIKEIISDWNERLKKRFEMLVGGNRNFEKEPLLLLIIQNNDIHDVISKDKEILAKFKEMTTKFKAMNFCVIYSNTENAQISFSSPDTLKMIKDSKHYLVFDDIQNIKIKAELKNII